MSDRDKPTAGEWAKAYGPNDDAVQIGGTAFQVNISAKLIADKINAALAAERGATDDAIKIVGNYQQQLAAEREKCSYSRLHVDLAEAKSKIEKLRDQLSGESK